MAARPCNIWPAHKQLESTRQYRPAFQAYRVDRHSINTDGDAAHRCTVVGRRITTARAGRRRSICTDAPRSTAKPLRFVEDEAYFTTGF